MRGDGTEPGLHESLATGWRELTAYVVAGGVYIAIGVAAPEFLFALVTAVGYVLVCLVLIPKLLRRFR